MRGVDPRRHRNLLLTEARELIDAGRLVQAQKLCDRLTADRPPNDSIKHLIGLIRFHRGEVREAIEILEPVAETDTRSAAIHSDLGACYFAAGHEDHARAAFRRAVATDDAYPAAHFNLGNLYTIDGAHEEAERAFRRAAVLQPSSIEALYNLALVLIELGRFDEAVAAIDSALEIDPNMADCHCARGVALEAQGDEAEAALSYRSALERDAHHGAAAANLARLDAGLPIDPEDGEERPSDLRTAMAAVRADPNSAAKHVALGRTLLQNGKPMEAVRVFRHAADISPQATDALLGLGEALDLLGNPDGADTLYGRVADLAPDSGEPWYSRAMISFRQGAQDDGFRHIEKALQLEPDNAKFHFGRGSNLLRLGRFEEGLEDFEWHRRLNRKKGEVTDAGPPFWDGSPMPDGHLLVEVEWGLGDIIMFSRFVPLLRNRVGKVTYQVRPSLLALFRSMPGVDNVVAEGDTVPTADARVRLMSLPYLLGTTLDTIPTDLGFLAVDEIRVAAFEEELSRLPGLKLGLCWRGRVDFASELDAIQRSLRLGYFADITRTPGVTPISLVKIEPGDELSTSGLAPYFVDFGRPLDDGEDAFVDTAALIKSLDLVISCDTSTAHLAATLGCPVWLLLPLGAEWRWFVDRSDSPWYPNMRLFRQKEQNIWSDVIVEVEQALDQYILERQ